MRVALFATMITLHLLGSIQLAAATPVQLRISVENLAPANSVSFAPLRFGVGNGTYDSFNVGQTAGEAIVSIAEGGSGSAWFPAFQAAEPNAVLGTVVPSPPGPLLPGTTASQLVTVDPSVNSYFTFGSMVVPSNDHFLGNDSPTQFRLFNSDGSLNITTIIQQGRHIWDAGSEATNPTNAAFLQLGTNDLRTPQGGTVAFDTNELSAYDGLTTAAGYLFTNSLTADTNVYRISFEVVPEPASMSLLGFGSILLMVIRRMASAKVD